MGVNFNTSPIITAIQPPASNTRVSSNTPISEQSEVIVTNRNRVADQPPNPNLLGNQNQNSSANVNINTSNDGIDPNRVTFTPNRNQPPNPSTQESVFSPQLIRRLDPGFLADFQTKLGNDNVLDAGEISDLYTRSSNIPNQDARMASRSFLDNLVSNNNGQAIPLDLGTGIRNITIQNSQRGINFGDNSYSYGNSNPESKPVSLEFNTALSSIANKGIENVTDQDLAILNNSRRVNRNESNVESVLGNPYTNVSNTDIDRNENEAYTAILTEVRDYRPDAQPTQNQSSENNPPNEPIKTRARSNFALNGTYESTTIIENTNNRLSIGIADEPTAGSRTDSTTRVIAAGYERKLGDDESFGVFAGFISNNTSVTTGNFNLSSVDSNVAFGSLNYTRGDTVASLSFNQQISGNNDNFTGDVTFSLSNGTNAINLGVQNRNGEEYGVISGDWKMYEDQNNYVNLRAGGTTNGALFLGVNGKLQF